MKFILSAIVAITLSFSGVALANDGKVTICHHTGSQTNPTVTITVSENAWEAHQKHGDTRGPCAVSSAAPTRTPTPSVTVAPTVSPRATGAPSATATANVPARTAAPTGTTKTPTKTTAPVKQLPSTATETSSVPYDPGIDD